MERKVLNIGDHIIHIDKRLTGTIKTYGEIIKVLSDSYFILWSNLNFPPLVQQEEVHNLMYLGEVELNVKKCRENKLKNLLNDI